MNTDLLIIGAGPFGVSLAAVADHHNVDYLIVGYPMSFWKRNMPGGMLLRSDCDWHLDPLNIDTIDNYLSTKGQSRAQVEPLSLDFYLGYADWFINQKQINPIKMHVRQLDYADGKLRATLEDERVIEAKRVVLAIGFNYFKNVPAEIAAWLPEDRYSHTCDFVDLAGSTGQRFLIVGGRQSAFEWAALLNESGADEVHVVHRHATPAFEQSDWSWVLGSVAGMVDNPAWYRQLSDEARDDLNLKFWNAGRLRLEPWLWPRLQFDSVKLWPLTIVSECAEDSAGALQIALDSGERIVVDQIILATGYNVDVANVPFLASGNIAAQLQIDDGFPVLDEHFQSSVPGLYFTSMAATQAFGSFFAFTVSTRASAQIIGNALIAA